MKFMPMNDNVLIQRDTAKVEEKKSPGGILIPAQVVGTEAPFTATVVAVGEKVAQECICPGAVVVVGKFSGTDVKLDDEDYTVVSLDDILGVVKG